MRLYELVEALNKDQYKMLMRIVGSFDAKRYEDVFKKYPHRGNNSYRIYLDASSVDLSNSDKLKGRVQRDVETVLDNHGYVIVDYVGNKAIKLVSVDDENDDSLTPEQQEIRNKRKNTPKKEQVFKIGKLLQKFDIGVYKEYVADNQAKKGASHRNKDLLVCISRHPYDIGGMSTGQSWNSCMNLDGGSNAHYVSADIKGGTLVAYLITKDDLNLKKPLARTLVLPFLSVRGEGEFVFGVSNKVYPPEMGDTGFLQLVEKWADEVNDSKEVDSWIFGLSDEHYGEVNSQRIFKVGKKDLSTMDAYEISLLLKNGKITLEQIPKNMLSQDMLMQIVTQNPKLLPEVEEKGLTIDDDVFVEASKYWGNFHQYLPYVLSHPKTESQFAKRNTWNYVDWCVNNDRHNEQALFDALNHYGDHKLPPVAYFYRNTEIRPSKKMAHEMAKFAGGYKELQQLIPEDEIDDETKLEAIRRDYDNLELMNQTDDLLREALKESPACWPHVKNKTPELEKYAFKCMKDRVLEAPITYNTYANLGFVPDEETQIKMIMKRPNIFRHLEKHLGDSLSQRVKDLAEELGFT